MSPVDVAFARASRKVKGKKTKKGKKAKSNKKKRSSNTPSPTTPKAEDPPKAEVVNSFLEVYRGVIKSLPVCVWPTSTKHGQHSYTV